MKIITAVDNMFDIHQQYMVTIIIIKYNHVSRLGLLIICTTGTLIIDLAHDQVCLLLAWQPILQLKLEYGCDPYKVCTLKARSSDSFSSIFKLVRVAY